VAESTYTVQGMTCGHCVNAVREEVSRIDGVRDVHVDLPTGTVTVIGDRTPATDEIHAAITEAGYQLVA
jgi:copper chaperone